MTAAKIAKKSGEQVFADAAADGHFEDGDSCWEFWLEDDSCKLSDEARYVASVRAAFLEGHAAAVARLLRPIEDVLGAEARRLYPGARVAHVAGRGYLILPAHADLHHKNGVRWIADEGDGAHDDGSEEFEWAWCEATK